MELTIGKEKVELVEAAKQSFEAQRARTVRALAVLVAADSGMLEAAQLEKTKEQEGSYLLLDSEKTPIVGLTGLKGHPKPKGVIRGAVVNQRVLQEWANKQVPVVVLDLLDKAFEQALGALGNGKRQKKAASPALEKARKGKKDKGLTPGKAAPKPGKNGGKKPTKRGYPKDNAGPRPGREK